MFSESPVTILVAGAEGTPLVKRSLSDTPIGRSADYGVNEITLGLTLLVYSTPVPLLAEGPFLRRVRHNRRSGTLRTFIIQRLAFESPRSAGQAPPAGFQRFDPLRF
jgi:hypothetical protein